MNREIKFRGKRTKNGEWVYGSLLLWSDGDATILQNNEGNNNAVWKIEVDPNTVGQFTGLKDKNGKEIYKGDILTDKFESIGIVEWQNGCFVVNFGDNEVFPIYECFDDSLQMWLVGNIHDNPELLNKND